MISHSININMKTYILAFLALLSVIQLPAQTTSNNLVEGGKLLVELVKIFNKNPVPQNLHSQENYSADLCFINSTADNLLIEVSKKLNDSTYKILPASISLSSKAHECLLEISCTVYHYKVYRKQPGPQVLMLEGELRLAPNEKMEREIK